MTFASPTLRLTEAQYRQIVGHCYDGLPDEACGLFAGPVTADEEPTGVVSAVYPCANAEASARTYTVDSRDLIKAMRDAEQRGHQLVGVFHSHTHTDAYPSPTDVEQAMEPGWVYVIVSLRDGGPVLRAYRVRDQQITECQVVLDRG
ncbi:MAG TPA: M67 family metallopeptidase [Acidimicrobiia bacterium]|nr:M67 family metallopeptidase [Acidimicrobiia bacterium]